MEPVWIPRYKNKRADKLSRMVDCDDWQIMPETFTTLDKEWGPHSYDRFASGHNARCNRFNSRFWCPGTSGVDTFSQKWSDDINWWVPPPKLINKTIHKIVAERANGTLVLPLWRSAPFWPKVWEGSELRQFVKEVKILPANVVKKGKGKNGIFGKKGSRFQLAVLKIRF